MEAKMAAILEDTTAPAAPQPKIYISGLSQAYFRNIVTIVI